MSTTHPAKNTSVDRTASPVIWVALQRKRPARAGQVDLDLQN
jgi:hypothetical protein